jgi:hypothetical protein
MGCGLGGTGTGCCWFRADCVVQGVGTMHVHHHSVRITWLLQGLLTVVYEDCGRLQVHTHRVLRSMHM